MLRIRFRFFDILVGKLRFGDLLHLMNLRVHSAFTDDFVLPALAIISNI